LKNLKKKCIRFTGSQSSFYKLDTIKSDMKETLVNKCPTLTPGYYNLTSRNLQIEQTIKEMKEKTFISSNY